MKIEELKIYQKDIVKFLLNAKKEQKLVHAYMFEGANGSGTIEAAWWFAMLQLCDQEEPCLNCTTCEKIKYNSHINVILIEPIENMIRKDQVEYLMRDFNKKSFDEKPLIYIIKDADKMNVASENALLKILEEPAPNHYAILTTENKNNILDTIISRCQVFHFNSPTNEYVEEYLNNNKIDKDISLVVSNYIYDTNKALEIVNNQKYLDIYNLSLKIVTNILNNKDGYVDYYLSKSLLDSLEEHRFLMISLIIILKEVIKIKNNYSNHFENLKNNVNLKRVNLDRLYKIIDIIIESKSRLELNTNISLLYSGMFARISKLQ